MPEQKLPRRFRSRNHGIRSFDYTWRCYSSLPFRCGVAAPRAIVPGVVFYGNRDRRRRHIWILLLPVGIIRARSFAVRAVVPAERYSGAAPGNIRFGTVSFAVSLSHPQALAVAGTDRKNETLARFSRPAWDHRADRRHLAFVLQVGRHGRSGLL